MKRFNGRSPMRELTDRLGITEHTGPGLKLALRGKKTRHERLLDWKKGNGFNRVKNSKVLLHMGRKGA